MAELRTQLHMSTTTWIVTNLVEPRTNRPVASCEKDVRAQTKRGAGRYIRTYLALRQCLSQALFYWNGICVGIMGLVEDWLSLCPKVSNTEVKYLDIFETAEETYASLKSRGAEVMPIPTFGLPRRTCV